MRKNPNPRISAASVRTNAKRARHRCEMANWFRMVHKLAQPGDVFDETDFAEPLWVLEAEYGEESGDVALVARKLGREGRWLPIIYPTNVIEETATTPTENILFDGVFLDKAEDLLRDEDLELLFGDPAEIAARGRVVEAIREVEHILARADQRPPLLGHNNPPAFDEFDAEMRRGIVELRQSIVTLKVEAARATADIRKVIQEACHVRDWSAEARVPTRALVQAAQMEATKAFGSTMGHGLAVGTLLLLKDLLPALSTLVHLIVVWLSTILPVPE